MPIPDYKYLGAWETTEQEHVYTLKGTHGSPPRTIGKVRMFVDVEAGAILEDYLGSSSRRVIEEAARRALDDLIAERYP